MQIATIHALQNIKNVITEHDILEAIPNDPTYVSLIQTIKHGFPNKKHDTLSDLKEYWEIRNQLTTYNRIAFLDHRIIIPSLIRKIILEHLHIAHQRLIDICRELFINFGVPEEINSDGSPQFMSSSFQIFMKNWGIKHQLSFAYYPQSNGRAESAVKTAKQIIQNNIDSKLSLFYSIVILH